MKRRRWLLIILTTLVVIAGIAYLVSRETEQRSAVEFLAAADQSADLHGEASKQLKAALESIGAVSQEQLKAKLASVLENATAANDLLDMEVPSSVAEPFGTITTASQAWVTGVTDVNAAIDLMVNRDIGEEAVTLLKKGLDMLRAGDVAYTLFLDTVADPIPGTSAMTFPPVAYILPSPDNPLLYDPLTIALTIGTSYEIAPRHDVGVVGQFEPEPVGDRAGVPLIPYSEVISLTAVVTNSGNEVVTDINVTLDLFDSDSGTTAKFDRTIASVNPGGSASVIFADLPITPGGLYQATLTATIPEDGRPDDNVWMMTLIRNEES